MHAAELVWQIGKGDLEKAEGYVRLPCPIGLYWSSAP